MCQCRAASSKTAYTNCIRVDNSPSSWWIIVLCFIRNVRCLCSRNSCFAYLLRFQIGRIRSPICDIFDSPFNWNLICIQNGAVALRSSHAKCIEWNPRASIERIGYLLLLSLLIRNIIIALSINPSKVTRSKWKISIDHTSRVRFCRQQTQPQQQEQSPVAAAAATEESNNECDAYLSTVANVMQYSWRRRVRSALNVNVKIDSHRCEATICRKNALILMNNARRMCRHSSIKSLMSIICSRRSWSHLTSNCATVMCVCARYLGSAWFGDGGICHSTVPAQNLLCRNQNAFDKYRWHTMQ